MINTVNNLLEKKGEKFINKILDNNLVITEKLDTFRLIFEKKENDLIFYTSDNKRIDLITRVLSDVYESAITEIPLITREAKIPEGYFFGIYYTIDERPLRIPYTKLPRYILTDITKRDENNKVIESLDYNTVKSWAEALCMGRPPILFEGKLNEEQKKLLIAYDTKQYEGETMTFSKMIEKIFGTSYSKENIIEGIIIKSKDKIAQIISYEFELLNEAYNKTNESRDFYDILIIDITNFLEHYNIPVFENKDSEEMYIDVISDIFNNYCKSGRISNTINEKYLTPPQFGYHGSLNKKLIKNKESLEWINSAPIYEALYKVFISSFRKIKKPYGLLNESVVKKFNQYVNTIKVLINENINETKENFILNESRSENIVINTLKKRQPDDIDNMRVISSIQRAFEPQMYDIKRGLNPCAVYLTSFEPFTNAQMNNLQQMNRTWNCPIVLCAISNEYKIIGEKFIVSDNLIKAQMEALSNDNPLLIKGNILLRSWNITEIFKYCRPNLEPMVIITDEGKMSELSVQLFLEEEIMGGRLSVDTNFNIGELKNEDKLQVFRAIEDNNYSLFKELTPSIMHNFMDNIFSEYRLWAKKIYKLSN